MSQFQLNKMVFNFFFSLLAVINIIIAILLIKIKEYESTDEECKKTDSVSFFVGFVFATIIFFGGNAAAHLIRNQIAKNKDWYGLSTLEFFFLLKLCLIFFY